MKFVLYLFMSCVWFVVAKLAGLEMAHGPCDICEQVKGGNEGHCNDYKKYAEAALNALLEGKIL